MNASRQAIMLECAGMQKCTSSQHTEQALWDGAKEVFRHFFNSQKVKLAEENFAALLVDEAHTDSLRNHPLKYEETFQEFVRDTYKALDTKVQDRISDLVQKMGLDWESCYLGRLKHRINCETRDRSGHNVAYWFFKVAALISNILGSGVLVSSN